MKREEEILKNVEKFIEKLKELKGKYHKEYEKEKEELRKCYEKIREFYIEMPEKSKRETKWQEKGICRKCEKYLIGTRREFFDYEKSQIEEVLNTIKDEKEFKDEKELKEYFDFVSKTIKKGVAGTALSFLAFLRDRSAAFHLHDQIKKYLEKYFRKTPHTNHTKYGEPLYHLLRPYQNFSGR
ncbi:MAG: hypothetical protein ABDH49_02410 [Candidatus Hydrothermales bacterium]